MEMMVDDFTLLTEADHWVGLDWIGDDPVQAVRNQIEGILQKQVSTATLEWVRLVSKPHFLAGGRISPHDSNQFVATHVAFAVPFVLDVKSEGRSDPLRGVFSWVAVLDAERNDRMFLDIDAELAWVAEQLKVRLYQLDPEKFHQTQQWLVQPFSNPPAERARWWEFWRKKP